MNDNHQPSDELLQFLFGELSESREAAVRKAVVEDADLALVVQRLEVAVAAVLAENAIEAGDDFNDRLRQRMSDVFTEGESPKVERNQFRSTISLNRLLTRSQTTWRWMMRSPVSRVAAAVILVLAIGGAALWFHVAGTAPAYADFIKPILEAKTCKYKETVEMTGQTAGTTTSTVMMIGPSRSRRETVTETERPTQSKIKSIQIWDGYQGKSLVLEPEHKTATLHNYADIKDNTPKDADPLGGWRLYLLGSQDMPGIKREPLGEKDLDGRRVIGFRITNPEAVFDLWGDPKTGMPVRIEFTTAMSPNIKLTMSDFEINVDLDESLFSVEPPAGYKTTVIQVHKSDESPAGEKDLIEAFRYYCELSGGTFPELLDHETFTNMVYEGLWMIHSLERPSKSQEKCQEEHSAALEKFDRGLKFAVRLPKESDRHYAGRDVSLGGAETPVFWYRPKDGKKYRVIYADLTVREADAPPAVSAPQTGLLEKNLIEMLRVYSEMGGGPFPDALDMGSVFTVLAVKNHAQELSEKPQKRSAEQERELASARFKIQRGLTFLRLLPKDADMHYAGKSVSIGAADSPIFWYRPKDAKTYRVIYADLTIRDADAPPKTPEALPEQDLIDAFREYGNLSDGAFPDALDLMQMMEAYGRKLSMQMLLKMCSPENGKLSEEKSRQIEDSTHKLKETADQIRKLDESEKADPEKKKSNEEPRRMLESQMKMIDEAFYGLVNWEKVAPGKKDLSKEERTKLMDEYAKQFMAPEVQKIMGATMRIQLGLTFIEKLPPEADAHYAGKGLSIGAADKPVFWYRPKDVKKYRVIYADLSVREADTAPSVPNALSVPAKASPKE